MNELDRRRFVKGATAALLLSESGHGLAADDDCAGPLFSTGDARWQTTYDAALAVLSRNVQSLPRFDAPVLIEGANYDGIWLECGPHEGLVYRKFNAAAARNNRLTFFALQREDGQLPANNKRSEACFGQIQMVVPVAATAWELAKATGDDELLRKAYDSCSRWEDWLMRYRNTDPWTGSLISNSVWIEANHLSPCREIVTFFATPRRSRILRYRTLPILGR
jgi:hypothetical protein